MDNLKYLIKDRKYIIGKKREAVERKIAWKLPRKVAMWAAIRLFAHATSGRWGNQIVNELTVDEALKRWDQKNDGPPEPYSPNIGQLNHVDPPNTSNTGAAPRGKHYKHTNSKGVSYYLNMKYVSLRGGELVPIYYFSKDIRKEASPLPDGYEVRENPRNGFLTVTTKAMIESEKIEEED